MESEKKNENTSEATSTDRTYDREMLKKIKIQFQPDFSYGFVLMKRREGKNEFFLIFLGKNNVI